MANFYQQCEKLTTSITTRKYLETYTFSANKRRAPILNLITSSSANGTSSNQTEPKQESTTTTAAVQEEERKESVSSRGGESSGGKPSIDFAKLIIIDNDKEILKNSVKVNKNKKSDYSDYFAVEINYEIEYQNEYFF